MADGSALPSWSYTPPGDSQSADDAFLRMVCLDYAGGQLDLTAVPPAEPGLAVAAVLGDVTGHDLSAVNEPTGPYGWSPLMYLGYARLPHDPLPAARALLAAGANPNDGRRFGGEATPFTVLTGVLGGGERDEAPHPHAIPLARLLLEAGADPNDGQALYNRMFKPNNNFLELLFEFGLREPGMLGELFTWAVTHDQRDRVALLAAHGVDLTGALELAVRNGHTALAAQLGGEPPALSPVDAYLAAVLAGGDPVVPREVVAEARARRPGLVVWAASLERIAAVETLVAAGFDVNAFARADVESNQEWQTALHTAVERGNAQLLQRLLQLGADKTLQDRRFQGTARDWAVHFGREDLAALLE